MNDETATRYKLWLERVIKDNRARAIKSRERAEAYECALEQFIAYDE